MGQLVITLELRRRNTVNYFIKSIYFPYHKTLELHCISPFSFAILISLTMCKQRSTIANYKMKKCLTTVKAATARNV